VIAFVASIARILSATYSFVKAARDQTVLIIIAWVSEYLLDSNQEIRCITIVFRQIIFLDKQLGH